MGPKKKDVKAEKGQQRAAEKEKMKIAEDKTFGLKNKNKSKTVQKFIKGIQQQAKGPIKGGESTIIASEHAAREEKKRSAQQAALLASLFKGTENIKKLSADDNKEKHDVRAIRERQRLDPYIDRRDFPNFTNEQLEAMSAEELRNMAKETQEVLGDKTDITCKYFLTAVKNKQYGWFWSCPNGGDSCQYRHRVPLDYDINADEAPVVTENEEAIEDILERERQALEGKGTPMTEEVFKKWKQKKEALRAESVEKCRVAEAKKSGGRGLSVLTGKDLFTFDPSLFVDDADAADLDAYEEEEDIDEIIEANKRAIEASIKESSQERAEVDNDVKGGPCVLNSEELEDNIKREISDPEDTGIRQVKADVFLQEDVPDDIEFSE